MRSWVLIVVCAACACATASCAQPTLLTCPPDQEPCADGCAPIGMCGSGPIDACASGNGGCSPDALCTDVGGIPLCECHPGLTGDGITCAACSVCDPSQFASAPCTPTMNTVCTLCSEGCPQGSFQAQPCNPIADRVCAPCDLGCATCTGPGALCTSCVPGFILEEGICVSSCGNATLDNGEACDDGNVNGGDGCSPTCTVEPGSYCYSAVPSICRAGSCVFEPATALPLGAGFALDGAGTASAAGLLLSQRSTIHTTADVVYPIMIEADVTYSGPDVTFLGARGSGLRQPSDADEPTDSLRARLSPSSVELAAGTFVAASAPNTLTLGTGVYHLRFVDDGSQVFVQWIDTADASQSVFLSGASTFHGGGDKGFVGGGDMGGVTVANVRVCSAPTLPVTAGLVARYSAIPSWTALQDDVGAVFSWQDISGNGHDLSVDGSKPTYRPGLVAGTGGVDFTGGARLSSAPFTLTTDVTVFAVIVHTTPAAWGAIAHHGDPDTDWSMEQAGPSNSSDVLHWQTSNDDTNMNLTLQQGSTYVLTGRFAGNARSFSAATLDGATPLETSIVDASHTITAGSKPLYVGTSQNGEASNAFIGDLVYFDRALGDGERDQMIDYLRRLWRP